MKYRYEVTYDVTILNRFEVEKVLEAYNLSIDDLMETIMHMYNAGEDLKELYLYGSDDRRSVSWVEWGDGDVLLWGPVHWVVTGTSGTVVEL